MTQARNFATVSLTASGSLQRCNVSVYSRVYRGNVQRAPNNVAATRAPRVFLRSAGLCIDQGCWARNENSVQPESLKYPSYRFGPPGQSRPFLLQLIIQFSFDLFKKTREYFSDAATKQKLKGNSRGQAWQDATALVHGNERAVLADQHCELFLRKAMLLAKQ